ncbi:hypothetical protein LPJ81_006371 [Coemansia sp. IMI 209127]|nr:hypothetical protein LPJ81_006371 [Coemansia sp. IMI 209127]
MYRSALRNAGPSVNDEVHSLESSEALQPSAARTHSQRNRNDDDDDFEYMSANNFKTDKLDDSITRSYVITPGAFADENEPEVVTHIRPESATDRQESSDRRETTSEKPGQQHVQDILGSSMTESYVNVDANESIRSSKARQAVKDTMDSAKENAKNAANKADKAASDAKNAAGNAADKAADKSKEAADNVADAAHDASSRAKGMLDTASKSVKDAASTANDKAHDAIHKARESGERFAKKAREEANEAEKAVRKHADETSPVTLRVMGIVAAALAAVSGYHYRLPGAQNQRIGFAGAVASAIIGLGTLATAFIRRNNN